MANTYRNGFYSLMEQAGISNKDSFDAYLKDVIGANNMNNHTGSGNNATDTLLGNNFELYQYLGDKDKKAFFKAFFPIVFLISSSLIKI